MVLHCMQHPMPRRVHVRTSQDLNLDPERPEYHRATVHWRRYTSFNMILSLLNIDCGCVLLLICFETVLPCCFGGITVKAGQQYCLQQATCEQSQAIPFTAAKPGIVCTSGNQQLL